MSQQDPSAPPGAVSNQNQEEAQAGHDGATGGARPGERWRGDKDEARGLGRERESHPPEGEGAGTRGGAGEGSQATGHPDNAG